MAVLFFILGSVLGSFYLVLGRRGPVGEKVVLDRSKCDNCKHVLSAFDLVPILSFLFLGGKCRYCKIKISILNPLVELVTGALFLFGYLHYGFCYNLYIFLIVSSLLVIIFISDFSYYIILDSPLVLSVIITLLLRWKFYGVKSMFYALLSGLALFLTLYIVKLIGDLIFKKESLGGGDIKLAGVMGVILGFKLGLTALILSSFLALPYSVAFLYSKKNNEVAYGPFLASSLFIVFLFITKFINLLNLIFYSI